MPQIEQLQVVHWGPLRPDPIEFTREGINVATGPNGSGKTCLLDAAKLILGAITWGEDGRRLEDELRALEELGRSHWFRPRRWADLLAAAGVSRALIGVISVRQGETDRTLDGRPEDLLRRMLELTGKQQT